MGTAEHKDFNNPDEVRTFENGKVELMHIGGGTIGKLTLEPGWQWSKHVKPIAQTDLCMSPHFQFQLSGRLCIAMEDGTKFETVSGDVSHVPPGHDAWVVGNEPVVLVDWSGATHFAAGSKF